MRQEANTGRRINVTFKYNKPTFYVGSEFLFAVKLAVHSSDY